MEREVLLTGIGGQGVQLASRILALAATREGRQVMSLGTYGGTMRGGNTDSTVVVADDRVSSPPIVSRCWSAIVVHPRFWEPVRAKLRPGGFVVFDSGLCADGLSDKDARWLPVDAATLAREVGAPMAASLVLIGAFAAATELVALGSLVAATDDALPPYRRQHLEANRRALEAGHEAAPRGAVRAWRAGEPAA